MRETIQSPKVIGAFTEEQAAYLSGLTVNQLRYWSRTGFFQPDLADPDAKGPFSRIYSLVNVAGLRVLGLLRRKHKVSLQHLRKVAANLVDMDQSLWNTLTLYVRERQVYTKNGVGGFRHITSGEDTLPGLPLRQVRDEVEKRVAELARRPDSAIGEIARERNVARNARVFAGTRIPVEIVREFREAGYSIDEILREYPTLTEKDIKAAINYLGLEAA